MSIRKEWLLRPVCIAVVCFLMCALPTSLLGQNISTAQLNGTVHDPTGALVPNATVTAADPSKGISRTTTSDGQGNYQILLLPPGVYTITATAPGFAKLTASNVILTVGEQAALQLTLSISGSETVSVISGADIIETQRSSQSTTVNQMRINNLPINGRNYINFTLTNSQIARDAAPPIGAIP
ncbi:MAG TPA: carboxypeptidase-like regulatory domain-containing protein, partial [Edaphobacter sp.]|nr:carboxypeptidase-like regulatory domain-containing protein [Edaphobacter sp.]